MDIEKVRQIIAEFLRVEPDSVKDNSKMTDDLGADSLDLVELCFELEEEFGIEMPDDGIKQWMSVLDVINLVKSRVEAGE
ncbi:Acyl carrier protein [Gammaproteobacteria bacterium]